MDKLEEVKKILAITEIREPTIYKDTVKVTHLTRGLTEEQIDELARQICQLFELKLPKNPYPDNQKRFEERIGGIK